MVLAMLGREDLRKVIARHEHECQKCKHIIKTGEVAIQGSFKQYWHKKCAPPTSGKGESKKAPQ
jgi:hypothetical protein